MRAPLLFSALIGCAALAVAGDARAHQCDIFPEHDAEVYVIRQHPDVLLFCGPCGDKAPTPFHIAKLLVVSHKKFPAVVDITDDAGRTKRVETNTVYVRLDPKKRVFTNAANRAMCDRLYEPNTIEPSPRR